MDSNDDTDEQIDFIFEEQSENLDLDEENDYSIEVLAPPRNLRETESETSDPAAPFCHYPKIETSHHSEENNNLECSTTDKVNEDKVNILNRSDPLRYLIKQVDFEKTAGKIQYAWAEKHISKPAFIELIRDQVVRNVKANVEVRIANTTFHCYLGILRNYTKKIPTTKDIITYTVEQINPLEFRSLYVWMLSDNQIYKRKNFAALLHAAKYLKVDEVLDHYWHVFSDSHFSEYEAFLIFKESLKYKDLFDLQKMMLSRIHKFFMLMVASTEFLEMREEHLCFMLSLSYIGANSELELFFVASLWLSANWPQRLKSVENVYSCIRFGFLPPLIVGAISNMKGSIYVPIPELMHVLENNVVLHNLASQGLYFSTLRNNYAKDRRTLQEYSMRLGVEEPNARRFLYDPNCPYHTDPVVKDPPAQQLTFATFLEYLRSLQKVTSVSYMMNMRERTFTSIWD